MDERVKFIARLLDGEAMSHLCDEFGVSRKTGYKILQRYRDCGVEGLTDRSRQPYRHANQLPLPGGMRAARGVALVGLWNAGHPGISIEAACRLASNSPDVTIPVGHDAISRRIPSDL